jgi:hypothetical protein
MDGDLILKGYSVEMSAKFEGGVSTSSDRVNSHTFACSNEYKEHQSGF